MSQEINDGIKKGIEAAVITSVSVMANMPFFDDAVAYLKKHPEVSIGLHFNITEGEPLSPHNKVSTLLREDGNFFYWVSMLVSLFFKSVVYKEIDEELHAQYTKLKSTKLPISHIDSHHHIHLFPTIYKKVIKFATKNNVNSLRCRVFNPYRIFFWLSHPPKLKQLIILCMCVFDSSFLTKKAQMYEVNNLYDIAWDSGLDHEKFISYLESLPNGTTELICHPAVMSKTGNRKFLEPRYKGLTLLTHPKVLKTIKVQNIKLISRHEDIEE
jgi:predicted glycoside hydrolase/deacetylase ChbG (UPF0249 family)